MKNKWTDQEVARMSFSEKLAMMTEIGKRDAAKMGGAYVPVFHYSFNEYAQDLAEIDDQEFYEYWKEREQE